MAYDNDPNVHHTSEQVDTPTGTSTQYVYDLSGTLRGTIPASDGSTAVVKTIGDYTPGFSGLVRLGNAAGVA